MVKSVNPNARPPALGGKLAGTLFFSVFLAMGLAFTVMIARSTAKNLAAYGWTRAEALILVTTIEPPRSDQNDPVLHVLYSYTYGDTHYEARRIDRDAVALETSEAYRLAERFVAGARVPCWVDPKNPGESVLQRKSPFFALTVFFPLIFVAVGGGGIWALWFLRGNKTDTGAAAPLSSRAKARGTGRAALALFFGVFLLVGVGVGYALFLRPLAQIVAARRWVEVPCEVVSSRVKTHDGDDGNTYSVDVVYRYVYGERHYTSNRYQFFSGSSGGYQGKAAVARRFRPGEQTRCYVDPADPADAVLERGPTASLWFGLIPLVFGLVGFFGLRYTLKRAAGPATPFTSGAANPFGATGLPATEGAQLLKPVVSRKAKLLGFILIALFWNGIVSIFVYHVIAAWGRGRGEWFPTLFLIPFVAVGIGLVSGVVYQLLALFNPRPLLTVSRGAVAPGEKVEVSWVLAGRTGRLRRLNLFLEGREEATYRRGTTTTTDRAVFATLTIIDTTDPIVMHNGATRLDIPAGAMHSFASSNNKIVWTLHAKGEVPNWPDIDDEYPFTVMPKPLAT